MAAFFSDYGLFVAKVFTAAIIVLIFVVVVIVSAKKKTPPDGLSVEHLNKRFEHFSNVLHAAVLGKEKFKKLLKEDKKEKKKKKKSQDKEDVTRNCVYVLDFKGDIRATATASLREEVSAVLAVATKDDQVLVRLENSGGTVHEHGLAASQLMRIKEHGVPLVVSVDKVAASGGYLMACVADRIIAAPFAIVGSIGVIAQLPNFHRFLEKRGVDFEQITAGRFKRTLTVFGKNTEEGREKMQEEIEDVHTLFKHQIAEHRPNVELEETATGEHWYGLRALELKLIDEISTSDDYLMGVSKKYELYRVTYKRHRSIPERLLGGAENLLSR